MMAIVSNKESKINNDFTTYMSLLPESEKLKNVFDLNQLMNAPGAANAESGVAQRGGLVSHMLLVERLAQRTAKNISATFNIDTMSLRKVCLLQSISKAVQFTENTDPWQLKRGYSYRYADNKDVCLSTGEYSIYLAVKAGFQFNMEEFEAMRIIDKSGDEFFKQKPYINILSLLVYQANDMAYALERECAKKQIEL